MPLACGVVDILGNGVGFAVDGSLWNRPDSKLQSFLRREAFGHVKQLAKSRVDRCIAIANRAELNGIGVQTTASIVENA